MYAAAFSEWASTGLTPRSLNCSKVRRITDSTKKTWLMPVWANARASHSAPFIAAVSAIAFPPPFFRAASLAKRDQIGQVLRPAGMHFAFSSHTLIFAEACMREDAMARIKHIALVTDDPAKTAEFYKQHFGLTELYRRPTDTGEKGGWLSDGYIYFAILKYGDGDAPKIGAEETSAPRG